MSKVRDAMEAYIDDCGEMADMISRHFDTSTGEINEDKVAEDVEPLKEMLLSSGYPLPAVMQLTLGAMRGVHRVQIDQPEYSETDFRNN